MPQNKYNNGFGSKVEHLDNRVGHLEARFTGVETRLETVVDLLDDIGKRVNEPVKTDYAAYIGTFLFFCVVVGSLFVTQINPLEKRLERSTTDLRALYISLGAEVDARHAAEKLESYKSGRQDAQLEFLLPTLKTG